MACDRSSTVAPPAEAEPTAVAESPKPSEPEAPEEPPASEPLPPAPPDVQQLAVRRVELLAEGKVAEATNTCRSWLAKPEDDAKAEAHKCLTNVLVDQAAHSPASGVTVSSGAHRLAVGGLAGPRRFSTEEIAPAIDHLDTAAELNPADLSIHEGRLFLCVASGAYERAVTSLALSAKQYAGAEPETWLQYMVNFPRSASTEATAFAAIVVRDHPESTRALVILGGWQTVAGQTEKARASLTKAVAASPRNAMAHWRLGELLEQEGDRAASSAAFRKSLGLDGPLAEERKEAYEAFKKRKP